jgi:hypothetical protein
MEAGDVDDNLYLVRPDDGQENHRRVAVAKS